MTFRFPFEEIQLYALDLDKSYNSHCGLFFETVKSPGYSTLWREVGSPLLGVWFLMKANGPVLQTFLMICHSNIKYDAVHIT